MRQLIQFAFLRFQTTRSCRALGMLPHHVSLGSSRLNSTSWQVCYIQTTAVRWEHGLLWFWACHPGHSNPTARLDDGSALRGTTGPHQPELTATHTCTELLGETVLGEGSLRCVWSIQSSSRSIHALRHSNSENSGPGLYFVISSEIILMNLFCHWFALRTSI